MPKNIAELSDYQRVHIGCIAVLGNKILSVGYNTTKTHPLQAHYNRLRGFKDDQCNHGLHAEIACLLPLRGSEIAWDKLKLYIVYVVMVIMVWQNHVKDAWLLLSLVVFMIFIILLMMVMLMNE